MSKVAIAGDSSGTGTFTIKSPNSNTDRTLNLPDNSGTVLTTASVLTRAQMPTGSVLQVVSTTKTDSFSVNANTATVTDITGLSVSITPTSATNKILVMYSISGAAANVGWATVLKRNGTAVVVGDASGSRSRVTDLGVMFAASDSSGVAANNYLDSPASTSALTYQLALFNQRGSSQVLTVNATANDSTNEPYVARATSTITVMEIAA